MNNTLTSLGAVKLYVVNTFPDYREGDTTGYYALIHPQILKESSKFIAVTFAENSVEAVKKIKGIANLRKVLDNLFGKDKWSIAFTQLKANDDMDSVKDFLTNLQTESGNRDIQNVKDYTDKLELLRLIHTTN